MKEAKERTIFDNYYSKERFEAARDSLWENYQYGNMLQNCEIESPEDFSDNEIFVEMDFVSNIEWEEFQMDFKNFLINRTLICTGSVGLWSGRFEGGSLIQDFNDMRKLWTDCDYIHIFDINGHLYVKCSHHDGTNFFELRELNQKGLDLYERHNWVDDTWSDRRLYETLFKNSYSVLPNYVHLIWGRKRCEYEKAA